MLLYALTIFDCKASPVSKLDPIDDLTILSQTANNGPYLELSKESSVYIKFDTSEIKGEIADARLEFKAANDSAVTIKFFLASHSLWSEHNVQNLPLTGKSGSSFTKKYEKGEVVSFPVDNLIDGKGIYTLIIKLVSDQNDFYTNERLFFNSKQSNFHPTLIVTSRGISNSLAQPDQYSCKGDFASKTSSIHLSLNDNSTFLGEYNGSIEMENNIKEKFKTTRLSIIDINGKDLETGDSVYIQTYSNNFLFFDPGSLSLLANTETCSDLHKFTIEKLNIENTDNLFQNKKNKKISSLDKIVLKTSGGTYLTTNLEENNKVTADSKSANEEEALVIHFVGEEQETLNQLISFHNNKSGNLYKVKAIEDASLFNGIKLSNKKALKSDNRNNTYLKFNLEGEDIIGLISSAALKLKIGNSNGIGTIKVFQAINSNWKEDEIDLSQAPAKYSLVGKYEGSFSSGKEIAIFLDHYQLIHFPQKVKTLIITMENEGERISFLSKESGNAPTLYLGTNGKKIIPSEIINDNDDSETLKNEKETAAFIENNQKVIFEVESIDFTNGWIPSSIKKNYTGEGYYEWKGDIREKRTYTADSTEISGVLTYPIKINFPGTYNVAVRGLNASLLPSSYIYISTNRSNWTKLLNTRHNQWQWMQETDSENNIFSNNYKVNLKKGINYISITGGSRDMIIDRVALYRYNTDALQVNAKTSTLQGDIIRRDYPYDSCFFEKKGKALICGETNKWHPISLTFESDHKYGENNNPNPFLDIKMEVTFEHIKTKQKFTALGFFVADGKAEYTMATSGNKWRAMFTPELTGAWKYTISFSKGKNVAISDHKGTPLSELDGKEGRFIVSDTNKSGKDLRDKGILRHKYSNYFQFSNSSYFIKNGIKSPSNFLSYYEFNNANLNSHFLHKYNDHASDYKYIGSLWGAHRNKGKNIMGAINYLSENNVNSLSFSLYNIEGGAGNDVFIWNKKSSNIKRIDISKLAQWEKVFSHMQKSGITINFILQESNNDHILNNGELKTNRKLYYREIIARFSHHPGVIWNLGERISMKSNSATSKDSVTRLKRTSSYIKGLDPYNHPIIVNASFNDEKLYNNIIADNTIDGISLEVKEHNKEAFLKTSSNIISSNSYKTPWAVFIDKVLDNNEKGLSKKPNNKTVDFYRREALWGNLIAKGSGMDLYLSEKGNKKAIEKNINTESFTGYEKILKQNSFAGLFFGKDISRYVHKLDLCSNIGNSENITTSEEAYNGYCLGIFRKIYILYFTKEGDKTIKNLPESTYSITWYNPLNGKKLQNEDLKFIKGSFGKSNIGRAPFSGDSIAILLKN